MATIIFPFTAVPEDATEGTEIGPVSVIGGVPGETFSFVLNHPQFEIVGDDSVGYTLVVKAGAEFDYENGPATLSFTIRANSTNGNTPVDNLPVTLNVTDVNERPYIAPDDRDVPEGTLPGTVVYTLVADDPDEDAVTYKLSDESEAIFDLVDNKDGTWSVLVDKEVDWLRLENELHNHFTVEITHGSEAYEDTFELNLAENQEPEISFQDIEVSQVTQSGTIVGVLMASDTDGHEISYTLTDESDELFDLVKNPNGSWSVRVASGETLDYETEEHKSFTVVGSDGFNDVERTFFLTFVDKAPTLSFTSVSVNEGAQNGAVVGKLKVTDPEDDDVIFTLSSSSAQLFELQDNEEGGYDIVVRNGVVLDYEDLGHHTINITASSGTHRLDRSFALNLVDQADLVMGTNGKDVLKGGAGRDILKGMAKDDTLLGNDGDDILYGGTGKDNLTGGKGQDVFVFDTKPSKKTNLDKVADFDVKDDSIWLDNKVFAKLGKAGSVITPAKLNKGFFKVGDKAKDKDDYLVYNKKTGILSYDADGLGSKAAIEIAQLKKGLALKASDFFVI